MSAFLNIAKPEARALAVIAAEAGFQIEVKDFGHTVAAHLQQDGKPHRAFYISRVFRPEVDGSNGWFTLTEERLREEIMDALGDVKSTCQWCKTPIPLVGSAYCETCRAEFEKEEV